MHEDEDLEVVRAENRLPSQPSTLCFPTGNRLVFHKTLLKLPFGKYYINIQSDLGLSSVINYKVVLY